jgi:predicted XRE-type DNA-binding protein
VATLALRRQNKDPDLWHWRAAPRTSVASRHPSPASADLRAALIRAIRHQIDGVGWSQSIAAQNLGLIQPRVSDLYRGKISKFSLDALVGIASKLGIHVRVEVDADTVLSA